MKSKVLLLLVAAVLLVLCFCSGVSEARSVPQDKECDRNFAVWALSHSKHYDSAQEREKRKTVFCDKLEWIQEQNANEENFKLGLNEFSDLTWDEFQERYLSPFSKLGALPNYEEFVPEVPEGWTLPASVDWRQQGVVSVVKNQGQCGSCWSFSASGAIESAHAISTGNLTNLSEQNLVDCSRPEGNIGCGGGLPSWAFEYVIKNGGIDTEASYPYLAKNGQCHYNAANSGATISSWKAIPKANETALAVFVAMYGPVSVAIDVNDSWANYHTGVWNSQNCPGGPDDLDHAVLVVGYGTSDSGQDYWIVKNSWGATWGDQGYILMARGHNLCGIAMSATKPFV